jgi:hypothetical protein
MIGYQRPNNQIGTIKSLLHAVRILMMTKQQPLFSFKIPSPPLAHNNRRRRKKIGVEVDHFP